jgi:CDP-diacylglycerol--glycerol-3-phosphate 3-phosphatidyltransferase
MNLPNQLTVGRLGLTVLFVWTLSSKAPFGSSLALALFVAASVTDYLDGSIARRHNLITDFGKLMDPLADKVMMAAALIMLVPKEALPPWAAIVVISREFLITGLRSLAASKGVVLQADNLGKHKTVWQIVMVLYFLTLLALGEWEAAGWISLGTLRNDAWNLGRPILTAAVLGITLFSGLGYVRRNWKIITSHDL